MNRYLKSGAILFLGSISLFYGNWYVNEVYYLPCTFGFNTSPLLYLYAPMLIYLIPSLIWAIGFYTLFKEDKE